jgi:hypothetical protein
MRVLKKEEVLKDLAILNFHGIFDGSSEVYVVDTEGNPDVKGCIKAVLESYPELNNGIYEVLVDFPFSQLSESYRLLEGKIYTVDQLRQILSE